MSDQDYSAFQSVGFSFGCIHCFLCISFLGVLRIKHWHALSFILTFRYVVASSDISEVDQPSRPISTVERINSTNDDDDQMLITERQATGSMTCKPEIKALCEEKGQNCTKHLGVYHCFIPGRCSEPCQNGGLCFNGRHGKSKHNLNLQCLCCLYILRLSGCICSVEFTGDRCENKLTCGGLQCMNGGSCVNYRCVCPSDYAGDRCEIDLHSCDDVVCLNGQCVHGKCYCNEGWTGVRCGKSTTSPCSPDPCLGDCRCVLSCRHSNGYQCVSEGGYIGRNCSIPVPTVSCRSDAMVVTISKRFYDEFDGGVKNSYIYISPSLNNSASFNKACRATLNDRHYVISIGQPWSKCGMELTSSREGDLVVKNKVWINKLFSFDLYDSPVGVVSIQCAYRSKLNVSTSIEPSVQLPRPTVTSVSQYNAEITLCKVSTCSEACPDSYKLTGAAVYTVGQFLHVGINVFTSSLLSSNAAVLQSASISCSPASIASSTTITLFQNSCATPSGLLLQAVYGQPSVSRAHHICLSFRLPRSAQCAKIYIHANLRVCHTGTIEKVCGNERTATRCTEPYRRRRDSKHDYIRPVVFGPIYLVERDGATEHVTYLGADQPVTMRKVGLGTPSVETSSGSFLITAVGSGLLLIIASTVVTLLCLKHKGHCKKIQRYDL